MKGDTHLLGPEQALTKIKNLEADTHRHVRHLEFEQATRIREEIERLRHGVFGSPGALAG